MGVPDGAGRERTAILPAGCQELGVPIGDMGGSQPLQFMVAQVWNDQLRDEPAVFLSRLASEPMEAAEPGAQIIGDHGLARFDQGPLMTRSHPPCKLLLGMLSLAANREVACLTLAGDGIWKIVFNAPACSAAPDNVAPTHDASPFVPNQMPLLRSHPLPKSLTMSASAPHSSPSNVDGISGTPRRGYRFSATWIS